MKEGKLTKSGSPKELMASLPADVKPLMGSYYTLDDVYLYYLGDELADAPSIEPEAGTASEEKSNE